jgi:hypothetical protein
MSRRAAIAELGSPAAAASATLRSVGVRCLSVATWVSAFYGIVIWMYHDEIHHRGRPHFHARYRENEASLTIETVEVLAGELPPRALRLVRDWASDHQQELRENWDRARRHEPLRRIEPLRCGSTICLTCEALRY